MDQRLFDVERYFDIRGIDYHRAGEKNVSRGWVNINCPYPDCDDPSWHCGVNLRSKFFSCYKCGRKGPMVRLIRRLEGCSDDQAEAVLERFRNDLLAVEGVDKGGETNDCKSPSIRCVLPREATSEFPAPHFRYLQERGFTPYTFDIIEKYRLRACHNLGEYKFRIIIPIFESGRLVTFTSRDITGMSRHRYRDQPPNQAIVPAKECVYNLDNVGGKIVIVEGPVDVWKIGDGAVCMMGTQYGEKQVAKIAAKNPMEVYVIFDSEVKAQERALKLCKTLGSKVNRVFRCTLNGLGDPGELSVEQVRKVRKEIGL